VRITDAAWERFLSKSGLDKGSHTFTEEGCSAWRSAAGVMIVVAGGLKPDERFIRIDGLVGPRDDAWSMLRQLAISVDE
jgi:hypothetical protein